LIGVAVQAGDLGGGEGSVVKTHSIKPTPKRIATLIHSYCRRRRHVDGIFACCGTDFCCILPKLPTVGPGLIRDSDHVEILDGDNRGSHSDSIVAKNG